MAEIKQKPWFKSFSNWIAILAVIVAGLVELMGEGVLPQGGMVAAMLPALLVILKRMSNENTVTRANAMVEAAKQNPSPPSP